MSCDSSIMSCDSSIMSCDRIYIYIYIQGRQEDAEEFLCWVLSRLHEEMVSAVRSLETPPDPSEGGEPEEAESGEDEEWQEVGPRNKSTITRRVS